MAEAFLNKVVRAAGIVTSYSGSTIGAGSTTITVTAITGIGVSFLVDNQNFVAGTRVHSTLPSLWWSGYKCLRTKILQTLHRQLVRL